jgi:hypothetical protein
VAVSSYALLEADSWLAAAHYVTLLERGYVLHEVTFAILFLLIVAYPPRAGRQCAWRGCWIVLIADLGYTFGVYDSTILARSLDRGVRPAGKRRLCRAGGPGLEPTRAHGLPDYGQGLLMTCAKLWYLRSNP